VLNSPRFSTVTFARHLALHSIPYPKMSLLFIAGALWLANIDSMQSAYHSLEDSSSLNRLFRQKAKEVEDQPELVRRIIQDAALNHTLEKHGAIGAAIYRVAIVAFVLRLCDVFVGSAAFVWCVLAAMVADYAFGVSDWTPGCVTSALVVTVSAVLLILDQVSRNLSTLLSAWSWIAMVHLTFVQHLHNDASDHDQARVFLTGIYLNAIFSCLVKLLSHCHSVIAFIGFGLCTVAIIALRGATAWVRMYHAGTGTLLTRLEQCVLYATKLLLYRLNATFRLLARAGGYLAPARGLCTPKPGTSYRYTALSGDQVRVLAIFPGRPSDLVRCRLDVVSLKEQPVYQAVSYVWGRGESTHWVVVEQNGEETVLDITTNAHALLAKLRSPWEERVIWIDGLCINQKDNIEKTAQVKMMENVYRGAWRVTAYLGASPAAPLVQALLAKIRFLRQGCGMSFPQMRDKLLAEYDKSTWEAVCVFLRNEWFNRVWIVQEAALAAQLHLLYGDVCMDWEILNQSIEFLVQDATKALFRFEEEDSSSAIPGSGSDIYRGLDGICAMLELRGDFEAPDKMTLGLALESSLSFNATDPRDKVFGLLSLTNDSKVTADYDLDCHDVYRNTMRHILVTDGNIEALNFAGYGRREPNPDLPSWVSDWKRVSQSGLYNKSYSAATTQQASLFSVPDHPNILFVKGWTSDTVSLLSDILDVTGSSASPLDLAGLKAFHNTAKSMTIQNAISYPSDQRPEVYVRTMIGDRSSTIYGTPPTTSKCMEMHASFLVHCANSGTAAHAANVLDSYYSGNGALRRVLSESNSGSSGDGPLVIQKLSDYVEKSCQTALTALEFMGLSRHVFRNRFCITEQGRTAIVPPRTQKGDVVALLAGAKMPFLLRPKGQTFELIGCCYVHGLMYGGDFDEEGRIFALR
jgi:hypothetical protein